MIKLNVNQILQEADRQRKRPKPLPKVTIAKSGTSVHTVRKPFGVNEVITPVTTIKETAHKLFHTIDTAKDPDQNLSHLLEREYSDLRMLRGKESSKIVAMVEAGSTQEQLRLQYARIESFRSEIQSKYDQIAYVKQHGQLPAPPVEEPTPKAYSMYELKDRKRKLIDKRCKLQAKLKPSAKPSKPYQIATWQMELDQAAAEYEMVDQAIKQLEGKI